MFAFLGYIGANGDMRCDTAPVKRAVIAGGGVLGTWHALELCRAGFAVQHLEAEAAPQGASVRNFGLIWVSGRRTGDELDAAQRSRHRWEEVAQIVPGIGFRPAGSLTLASHRRRAQGDGGVRRTTPMPPADRSPSSSPTRWRALNPAVQRRHRPAGCTAARTRWSSPACALGALRELPLGARFVRLPPGAAGGRRGGSRPGRRHGHSLGGRPGGGGNRRRLRSPARHRAGGGRSCAGSASR